MECRSEEGNRDGLDMIVVDTPPIPDDTNDFETEQKISQSILLTAPGPRCVILTVRQDQKPEELERCIRYIRKYFGKGAFRYVHVTSLKPLVSKPKELKVATSLANFQK